MRPSGARSLRCASPSSRGAPPRRQAAAPPLARLQETWVLACADLSLGRAACTTCTGPPPSGAALALFNLRRAPPGPQVESLCLPGPSRRFGGEALHLEGEAPFFERRRSALRLPGPPPSRFSG